MAILKRIRRTLVPGQGEVDDWQRDHNEWSRGRTLDWERSGRPAPGMFPGDDEASIYRGPSTPGRRIPIPESAAPPSDQSGTPEPTIRLSARRLKPRASIDDPEFDMGPGRYPMDERLPDGTPAMQI